MSLNDFLADASQGKTSWADEMDDLMPPPRDSSYRRMGGDSLANAPDRTFDRQAYPPRDELPLPDKPPYTAFVGNLAFDVMDSDVEQFFAPANVVSVRIVSGHDGKPKGFGYVEFQTLDDLKSALDRSGAQMVNRTVRVSVAEPPKSAFGGGGGDRSMMQASQADDASQWRRSAPLPPSEPRGGFGARPERTQRTFESSGPGFDNMDVSGGVRSGFGAKFQAAPPASARPPPRDMAPLEPSLGDQASQWRTGKPVEARSPALSRPDGPNSDSRRPSYRKFNDANEVDDRFASQERMGFGSKFNPDQTPPDTPGNTRRSFGLGSGDRRISGTQASGSPALPPSVAEGQENWRSAKKADTPSGSPVPVAAPAERRRLELKPRSAEPAGGASPTAATSSAKPSPFGNAKPVDASEREKEIEQKLSQKEKERQEELKAKKEKIKAERAASAAATATDPTTQAKPEKKERPFGARKASASGNSEAAAAKGGEAKEVTSPQPAAATKKVTSPRPTPTGAWGGGRKPSGALNADGSVATPEVNGTSDEQQTDQVADKLQETSLKA